MSTAPSISTGRSMKTKETLFSEESTSVDDDADNVDDKEKKDLLIGSHTPLQVASDLIDATCHEILLLGSDQDEVPPHASYIVLACRLDYYMDTLLDGIVSNKDDGCRVQSPRLDENSDVWRRLLMAKVVMDVCSRKTYPCLPPYVETSADKRPALIDAPVSFWQNLREELRRLQVEPDIVIDLPSAGIFSQMEALEALAELRDQLRRADAVAVKDGGDVAKQLADKFVNDYVMKTDAIDGLLQKFGMTHYTDLIVPQKTFFIENEADDKHPTKVIDGMILKRVFPLKNLQVEVLQLLRSWEAKYLATPTLFVTGYFKHESESKKSATAPCKAVAKKTPSRVREYVCMDIDDCDEPKGSRKRSPPRVVKKTTTTTTTTTTVKFEPDSDGSMSHYSPARRKKKEKKQTRVPFSDSEKKMLLEGVNEFGVGQWAKILAHYGFTENDRTSVNLKDLYRTLTKGKKGANEE